MLRMMSYSVKSFLRSKDYIIWSIIFPLAYFTIFYFALGNLASKDSTRFPKIELGIVVQEEADQKVADVFESIDFVEVKKKDEDLTVLKGALREDEIKALVYPVEEKGTRKWDFLLGYSNPYPATVVREVVQQMNAIPALEEAISEGIRDGHLAMPDRSMAQGMKEDQAFQGVKVISQQKGVEAFYQYFFAALAYLSFFPIHVGLQVASQVEANQTPLALRRLAGPKSKWLLFLTDLVPLIVFQMIIITIAYYYSQFLGLDYGGHHIENLILLWLGTSAAILFGTVAGSLLGKNQKLSNALGISLPLFFGFLSGMMGEGIIPIVQKSPILSVIQSVNPIGIVSRGLYILKLEGPTDRYLATISRLSLVCLVLFIFTLVFVRRKKYENL